MKLNCKPGDMAIVVPPSRNAGAIVQVFGPFAGDHFSGLFAWHVKSIGGKMLGLHKDGRPEPSHRMEGDAWLRPVSGLPVDEETRDQVMA